MKKDNEIPESNNTNGKRAVFMVIFILIVLLVVSWPAIIELEKAIEGGPEEGYAMFNASRYFFRYYYPEDWITDRETDGFLMNKETGLVGTLVPAVKLKSNIEGEEDTVIKFDSILMSFFYADPAEFSPKYATPERVTEYYRNRLLNGLMPELTGVFAGSNIDYDNVGNENTDLYALDFTGYRNGVKVSGILYCAKREKCIYAITLIYENSADYNRFREEIENTIRSYRLTVLSN